MAVQSLHYRLPVVEDLPRIQDAALRGESPAGRPRQNAHIHLPPNFSAFDTVEQALDLAAQQSVRVLGASNYYDYSLYEGFAEGAAKRGIYPLFGMEIIALIDDLVKAKVKINDPGNFGKMYICGKGLGRVRNMSDRAREMLQEIRGRDSKRMAEVAERLAACFVAAGLDTGLNEVAVKARIVARHGCPLESVTIQERHLAQAFQEVLFERSQGVERIDTLARLFGKASAAPDTAVTVQNEIRSYLMKAGKPAFVPDTFGDLPTAKELILELGGIPCYPTLADGADPVCGYEEDVHALTADLKSRGIYAAEFIPTRNKPEVLSKYVHAMRSAGLVITAGTEHNTLDRIPLTPTCIGGAPVPSDIEEIFWEGACVTAAHQLLTAAGRIGYVNSQGEPNPEYADPEARIAALRALGAATLAQFGL